MWIETALLYAWIRVCLQGAGSRAVLVPGAEKLRRTQRAPSPGGVRHPLSLSRPSSWGGRCRAPPGRLGKQRRHGEREGSRSNSA